MSSQRVNSRHGHTTGRPRNEDADPVMVDRLVFGYRAEGFSTRELWAALDRLDDGTRSASELAHALGVASRTVVRRRAIRRAQNDNGKSTNAAHRRYAPILDPGARGRIAQRPTGGQTRAQRDYEGGLL